MKDYNIKSDETGNKMFTCEIWWTDEDGCANYFNTGDIDLAQTVIKLLQKDISLSDLEQ